MQSPAFGAVISVTNDFPTIQAAINAANSNDTIQVQSGSYREFLVIFKPLRIIGSGSTNCIVHHTNDVLVAVSSGGVVELAGLEIIGGDLAFGGIYTPSVPQGIVASNTTVVLNDVTLNTVRNFAVTVVNGSLYATNVALYTREATALSEQWDVGLQLKGCFARIFQLSQLSGKIDHTININDPPANYSDVQVDSSTIQASRLGYGECVRTYTQSSVVITNCDLFRAPGGDPVNIGNQAVGVNGYSNTVLITGNTMDRVPTGIRVFGSLPNSNIVRIEHNEISNCESNGVLTISMSYEGIDLGGGSFQSAGQNSFFNPGARDVELFSTSADIHALSNCWTTANPDNSIIDKLDSSSLGQVFYSPTFCVFMPVCTLSPTLATNTVGTAHTVTATVTTNSNPANGVTVNFSVTAGPNIAQSGTATTGVSGQGGFTYSGDGGAGTDTIQAIVTVSGISATGTAAKVWVNAIASNLPPVAACQNVTVAADASCAAIVPASAVDNGSSDPDGTIMNRVLSPAGPFALGITPVTLTVTDNNGATNSCQATITVVDQTLPSISCSASILTNVPNGVTGTVVNFPTPAAADNCGIASTSCSPSSGSTFALGTNTVICAAIDTSSNTNTCSFTIIVASGNLSPIAVCQDVTANADVSCAAAVPASAVDNGSSDPDGVVVSRVLNPAGPYAIGVTPVTLTVTDNNGATNSCQATITVMDQTLPSITCSANIVTNVAHGSTNAVVNFPAPTAGDNCGIANTSCTPVAGSTFAVGTNTVICTAVDTSDNTNTCSFTIIVSETPASTQDLSVLTVVPPGRIALTSSRPSQTKPVRIQIENLGPRTETIADLGKLTNLVTLAIQSLGGCPTPAVTVVPPKARFPLTIAPKRKLTVLYNVTFDCANDPLATTKTSDHSDFRYTVTLNRAVLDGLVDANSANDGCPRGPNGADKGCGGRDPITRSLGAVIFTDIVQR